MKQSAPQLWLLIAALTACSSGAKMQTTTHHDAGRDAGAGSHGGEDARVADAADGDAAAPGKHRDGGTAGDGDDAGTADAGGNVAISDSFDTRVTSAIIFGSGHSLLDDPLLENITAIAQSLGDKAEYNEQIVIGSPIRVRTRGDDPTSSGWSGYSQGKNRDGTTGLNVIDELRNPMTLGAGEHYDTLLIAEREDLIDVMIWEDSERYLRHFHERLIKGNAKGTTYYYATWGEIDRLKPAEFVTYERAALLAWECQAERINTSLAAEGRSDRIVTLPASGAMAELVDEAISKQGVAGITQTTPAATMDVLFKDNQHSLPVGVYYTSLVNYASIYHHSPMGAWAPSGVSAALAKTLQTIAWTYVHDYYEHGTLPTQSQCLAVMKNSFCGAYFTRYNETTKQECLDYFAKTTNDNALYYDQNTDAAFWLPAPP